ncbi:flagellar biosynthesis protein FlhB [Rhizobium sp. SSA_523]|uniref:flagellar biosynthesis protein FlhB n=1 Tax=Rhizobium sp. SSA_523 TaxID=2952477 RepID=UPI002091CA40|nr:flagellar biosynthesis protein FlhB [Rhizobium sp. SSA_523]MCO5732991.1 flagellar biosynthesis protein FlhB [Rhizobium sp. SSA_523]WKC23875.1 flagellar biosynthesis protein FlhB [Rhizobium sp. SSA_523]
MSDEDKDSKTEAPSHKKLQDAAEKGNVPFSKEVTLFASSLAFYFFMIFFMPTSVNRLGESLKDIIEKPDQWKLENASDVVSLASYIGHDAAMFLMPVMLLFALFGLGSSFAQNMPSLVLERIRPQLSRVSPIKGFGRIFSLPGLVEFSKSIFKIAIVGITMFFVMRSDFLHTLDALFADPIIIPAMLFSSLKKMMIVILLATAVLAAADFFWTRHHWYSQLKMTKQEVKDENKQAMGDPLVKSRQRSVMRSRARQRMMNNVPRATLVIANPTHYAVALRYVREESEAPVVVAKGTDLVALKIRELAEANQIPVFEDAPLARSMFAQVSVDSVIPPAFYKAVAELIHRVYAARAPKRRIR